MASTDKIRGFIVLLKKGSQYHGSKRKGSGMARPKKKLCTFELPSLQYFAC